MSTRAVASSTAIFSGLILVQWAAMNYFQYIPCCNVLKTHEAIIKLVLLLVFLFMMPAAAHLAYDPILRSFKVLFSGVLYCCGCCYKYDTAPAAAHLVGYQLSCCW